MSYYHHFGTSNLAVMTIFKCDISKERNAFTSACVCGVTLFVKTTAIKLVLNDQATYTATH